ncbi:hypothetical protein [uncultured Tenacibaculum sp.]|uniref:hypothetical protein n=1 Tax=uncultured Tenacibaculum sp. TaxID=174713 RepID=UPI00260BAD57|nr:hypothetical protein [uncultured Tenacibaculum sp.]
MKKVTLVLTVLFGLSFLIGCTDSSKELEDLNAEKFESEIINNAQFIDKDEIENPRDKEKGKK